MSGLQLVSTPSSATFDQLNTTSSAPCSSASVCRRACSSAVCALAWGIFIRRCNPRGSRGAGRIPRGHRFAPAPATHNRSKCKPADSSTGRSSTAWSGPWGWNLRSRAIVPRRESAAERGTGLAETASQPPYSESNRPKASTACCSLLTSGLSPGQPSSRKKVVNTPAQVR